MELLGKVIILEGPRGVGKSTISAALAQRLRNSTDNTVETKAFPGAQPGSLGLHIYDLHHHQEKFLSRTPHPIALQTLHFAAHLDNFFSDLLPLVKNGATIVLHRCWWSTLVFGALTDCDRELLSRIVAIERELFAQIDYTVVLLERNAGVNPDEANEYSKVAEHEAYWRDYVQIRNDNIDSTVDAIIEAVC